MRNATKGPRARLGRTAEPECHVERAVRAAHRGGRRQPRIRLRDFRNSNGRARVRARCSTRERVREHPGIIGRRVVGAGTIAPCSTILWITCEQREEVELPAVAAYGGARIVPGPARCDHGDADHGLISGARGRSAQLVPEVVGAGWDQGGIEELTGERASAGEVHPSASRLWCATQESEQVDQIVGAAGGTRAVRAGIQCRHDGDTHGSLIGATLTITGYRVGEVIVARGQTCWRETTTAQLASSILIRPSPASIWRSAEGIEQVHITTIRAHRNHSIDTRVRRFIHGDGYGGRCVGARRRTCYSVSVKAGRTGAGEEYTGTGSTSGGGPSATRIRGAAQRSEKVHGGIRATNRYG